MKIKYKKLNEKFISLIDNLSGYNKKIIMKTFRLPNGILENFFIDKASDSVQILAVMDKTNDIVCVKQFRAGEERFEIELPGGGLEKGEDPLEAAERELLEETGLEGKVSYLGEMNYSPYSTGRKHMFVAEGCRKVSSLGLDDNEFLKLVKWKMDKFRKEIQKGTIRGTDGAYMGLDFLGML